MQSTTLIIGDEFGLRGGETLKVDRRKTDSVRDPQFGHWVKVERVRFGFTQVEFADAVGIHQVTLSRIETAINPITADLKKRIQDTFYKIQNQR